MGKVKQKYLIVQPHSDDALFCCSNILFGEDYEVQVLTVENDPKRIVEDKNLYDFLRIKYHHLHNDFIDDSYYAFYKKEKEMTTIASEIFIEDYYGTKLLPVKRELVKFLNDFLNKNPDYSVISPLGIGHPFHFYVQRVLTCNGLANAYYRDFPHSYKRKAKKHLEEVLSNFDLSKIVDITDFDDMKWKLASKFYRSQSGLLFYEQGYIKKRLPEELYVPKPSLFTDDLPF